MYNENKETAIICELNFDNRIYERFACTPEELREEFEFDFNKEREIIGKEELCGNIKHGVDLWAKETEVGSDEWNSFFSREMINHNIFPDFERSATFLKEVKDALYGNDAVLYKPPEKTTYKRSKTNIELD